jgi:peptide/nickel transport system substrate-binding protein
VMAAEATVDKPKRIDLYRKALKRIADQAYLVPVYGYTQNFLISPDLVFEAPKDGVPRFYLAKWK